MALDAYKRSLDTRNPNAEPLSKTILRAKQAIWAAKETARLRTRDATLRQVEELLEADMNKELEQLRQQFEAGQIGAVGYAEDQRLLREETQKKINDVREVFAAAKGDDLKERVGFCLPSHPSPLLRRFQTLTVGNARSSLIILLTASVLRSCTTPS